jgi:hypothetical protein
MQEARIRSLLRLICSNQILRASTKQNIRIALSINLVCIHLLNYCAVIFPMAGCAQAHPVTPNDDLVLPTETLSCFLLSEDCALQFLEFTAGV